MILAALFVQQMRTSAFLLGFGFCIVACNAQHPVEAGIAYEQAIERASASDTDGALAALRVAVEVNDDACQHALLDTHFTGGVRDEPGFRDLIHNAAVQHTISRLTLVPEDEPGEWIVLVGEVVDPTGTPVAGAVVRLFATDAEGRYHPTLPGEDVPRIFGTVVTDSTGQFAIETVRPGSYPAHATLGTSTFPFAPLTVRCGLPHRAAWYSTTTLCSLSRRTPNRAMKRFASQWRL